MSPVQSPPPFRHSIMRTVCSPTALFCGFVAILVVTCPNARGVDGLGVLSLDQGGDAFAGSTDMLLLDVPATAARPIRSKSSEPRSTVRPATLEERDAAWSGAGDGELFRYSRAAVPLLVEPLRIVTDAPAGEAADIVPMAGPAVGVRSKPQSGRR